MKVPTLADVREAQRRIAPYLKPTPLRTYPALNRLVGDGGAEIWVKHENFQPTGAFKVRGGVNLIGHERPSQVISASTGNHGQSIAYASRIFGTRATIVVPERANPGKVEAMRDLGAEIIEHGRDYDEAREHCERVAAERGWRYVHSGNEPDLIAGVGTETLEILEEQPEVEIIFVPVGGGSGAAGACVAAPPRGGGGVRVVGVQSDAAPAAFLSWRAKRLVEDRMATRAEGLATRTAFELPQRILWERLDDFVLVTEDEIRRATLLMIEKTRTLVEPAGATPLAAALKLRPSEKKIALVCSGGNIHPSQLKEFLA